MMGVCDGDGRRVGSGSHVINRPDVRLDRRAEARVQDAQLPEVAGLKAEQALYAAVVTVAEGQAEIGQPDSQERSRNQGDNSPSRGQALCQQAEGRSQRGHSPAFIEPP